MNEREAQHLPPDSRQEPIPPAIQGEMSRENMVQESEAWDTLSLIDQEPNGEKRKQLLADYLQSFLSQYRDKRRVQTPASQEGEQNSSTEVLRVLLHLSKENMSLAPDDAFEVFAWMKENMEELDTAQVLALLRAIVFKGTLITGSTVEDYHAYEDFRYGILKNADFLQKTGNFLRVRTFDTKAAIALCRGSEFFYSKSNSDFAHPDFDNERGGFRILRQGEEGNFYFNGQRISYKERDQWNTVPGFHFWSREVPHYGGRRLSPSRDRDLITAYEVREVYLPFMVESMGNDDLELALLELESYYPEDARENEVGGCSLSNTRASHQSPRRT